MVLLVNYNDQEWITKFITEVLKEDDFLNAYTSCKFIEWFLPILGYKEVKNNLYVFINKDNEIEVDSNLEKFNKFIFHNPVFINRYKNVVNKFHEEQTSKKRVDTVNYEDDKWVNDFINSLTDGDYENFFNKGYFFVELGEMLGYTHIFGTRYVFTNKDGEREEDPNHYKLVNNIVLNKNFRERYSEIGKKILHSR